MIHSLKMPILMGTVMGLMMLGMLHGLVTGESGVAAAGVLVFIGAHVLAIAVVAALAVFGASRFERVRAGLARLHRPSAKHIAAMMATAAVIVALAHLIHGAP